ncbi:MAG: Rnase Y domain-containing protein, partial [Candidatus Enteromonas sp.]
MQLHLWLDTGATIGIAAGAAVVAAVATFLVMFFLGKSKKSSATKAADGIIKDANLKAERIIKNAQLDAKQAAFEAKQQSENDARARKAEIAVEQQKLDLRQAAFDERESRLLKKEEDLENKSASLDASLESYKKRKEELDAKIDDIIKELEKVSGMSVQEAHDEIMARVESRMSMEISAYIKNAEDEAKDTAQQKAVDLLSLACQRYAQDVVTERTVSVVALP